MQKEAYSALAVTEELQPMLTGGAFCGSMPWVWDEYSNRMLVFAVANNLSKEEMITLFKEHYLEWKQRFQQTHKLPAVSCFEMLQGVRACRDRTRGGLLPIRERATGERG